MWGQVFESIHPYIHPYIHTLNEQPLHSAKTLPVHVLSITISRNAVGMR